MTEAVVQSKCSEPTPGDRELLALLARGGGDALGALYDRHASRLLGVASRILGNRSDAEDLVHDLFVEVWQQADRYEPQRASVATWLLTKLRSRALDRLRRLQVARRHALAPAPAMTRIAGDAEADADALVCRAAFRGLSEAQRTVLQLCYFRGMTCREIATHCDLPIGTVKSRLAGGLRRLREVNRNGQLWTATQP